MYGQLYKAIDKASKKAILFYNLIQFNSNRIYGRAGQKERAKTTIYMVARLQDKNQKSKNLKCRKVKQSKEKNIMQNFIQTVDTKAQELVKAINIDLIQNAQDATNALNRSLGIMEWSNLIQVKILEKAKKNEYHKQCRNEKGLIYGSFTTWLTDSTNISKNEINALLSIAELVGNDGFDILPRQEKELPNGEKVLLYTRRYSKSQLVKIRQTVSSIYFNELKESEQKNKLVIEKINELSKSGIFNSEMSVQKLGEVIKLSNMQEIPQDENATESKTENATESKTENATESKTENATESKTENGLNEFNALYDYLTKKHGKKLPQTLANYLKGIKEYL